MGKLKELKSKLGLGARTNKYRIMIDNQYLRVDGQTLDALATSASIPARAFNELEIWNKGKMLICAGEVDYSGTWSVTFIDTQDHKIRKAFMEWMNTIIDINRDRRIAKSNSAYMGVGTIQQLDGNGDVTVSYIFTDLWPKQISETTMADTEGNIVEFTVEFNYTSWDYK